MLPKQTAWEGVLQHRAQLCAHQRKHRWAARQGGAQTPPAMPTPALQQGPAQLQPLLKGWWEQRAGMLERCPGSCRAPRTVLPQLPPDSMVCSCSLPTLRYGYSRCQPLSHRKSQLLLTCGSPGSTPGCKGCISSPRLELKSLLGNSGPADTTILFLPPVSPVQSPKSW